MNEVTVAGRKLQHFHIAAFFRSREEEYEVLHSYIQEGIHADEKAVYIKDGWFDGDTMMALLEYVSPEELLGISTVNKTS